MMCKMWYTIHISQVTSIYPSCTVTRNYRSSRYKNFLKVSGTWKTRQEVVLDTTPCRSFLILEASIMPLTEARDQLQPCIHRGKTTLLGYRYRPRERRYMMWTTLTTKPSWFMRRPSRDTVHLVYGTYESCSWIARSLVANFTRRQPLSFLNPC